MTRLSFGDRRWRARAGRVAWHRRSGPPGCATAGWRRSAGAAHDNLQVSRRTWTGAAVPRPCRRSPPHSGVTCNHCHVFNGPGRSDERLRGRHEATKNMARAMMRMVRTSIATVPEGSAGKPADQAAASAAPCAIAARRRRPLRRAHPERRRRRVAPGPERRRAARRPLERHRPERAN